MAARTIEFESLSAARELLRGYDAQSRRWAYSFDSPFWKAVRHAHALGYRGRGRRVAVVDSGCDLSVPQLRASVDRRPALALDPGGHGSAVALLILEVAPECRVDVYAVGAAPTEAEVAEAIDAAAASDAQVINISLGVRTSFALKPQALDAALRGDGSIKRYTAEAPPCVMCQAADRAAQRGKLVFAAAGNAQATVSCPARAPGVVAAGFGGRRETAIDLPAGGSTAVVYAALADAPQAVGLDISLAQIPGVLGTSFAAPLYAGVAALGLDRADLCAYLGAIAAGGLPQRLHADVAASSSPTDPQWVEHISLRYAAALARLPHVHCDFQAALNPAPVSDPAECAFCGLFAEPLLVNAGLWLLCTGHADAAGSLLEAARALAPWSPDAVANLAAVRRTTGDVKGAIALFEDALRLRPAFPAYADALRAVVGDVRHTRE